MCDHEGALIISAFDGVFRRDGEAWIPLPGAPNAKLLASFDGSIYACGTDSLARWDGAVWQPVAGFTGLPDAMLVYDGALIIAGDIEVAGLPPAHGLARWDGVAWTDMASPFTFDANILAVHDPDGAGPTPALLFAGDWSNLACWDGATWTPMPDAPLINPALPVSFDEDGPGPLSPSLICALYEKVIRLRDGVWSDVGHAPLDGAFVFAVFDDGASGGPSLYALGWSDDGTATKRLVKWNGSTWSIIADWSVAWVRAMLVLGDRLFVGGQQIGVGPVSPLASWRRCGSPTIPGDLDRDGDVDFIDLNLLLSNYGQR